MRNFLYANAVYWLEEFHADGLRVDGVASMLYLDYAREEGEWTPNKYGGRENLEAVQFLQEMNATVYKRVPGIVTIAEESTSWPQVTGPTSSGGLGFGFKWNMGWMHDTLGYLERDPIYRSHHHHELTFAMTYQWTENFVLPLSHDEVVHGKGSLLRKMPGDRWQQLASLRAYYGYMWAHPGKQLIFMGCEIGQESEWAESRELDWWLLEHPEHRGLHSLVRDLNGAYTDTPAAWQLDGTPEGFQWIDANDAGRNVYSFVRRSPGSPDLVCLTNFSAVPHGDFRLALPATGEWTELVNTDAAVYGGSGVGNLGSVTAVEADPLDADAPGGLPAYTTIVVPPLATVWFEGPELMGLLKKLLGGARQGLRRQGDPRDRALQGPALRPRRAAGRVGRPQPGCDHGIKRRFNDTTTETDIRLEWFAPEHARRRHPLRRRHAHADPARLDRGDQGRRRRGRHRPAGDGRGA